MPEARSTFTLLEQEEDLENDRKRLRRGPSEAYLVDYLFGGAAAADAAEDQRNVMEGGMSPEARAIVMALNSSLGTKIDMVNGQLVNVTTRLDTVASSVKKAARNALRSTTTGWSAWTGLSSEAEPEPAVGSRSSDSGAGRYGDKEFIPKSKRKLVVVGGFEYDTPQAGVGGGVEIFHH